MPSNRSKKPPWPGKKPPESFKRAWRLSHDSNKSPIRARVQIIKVKGAMNIHERLYPRSNTSKVKPMHAKK